MMKRFTIFTFIWIIGLNMASAWSQINTNLFVEAGKMVAVPVVEHVDTWLTMIQNFLTGAVAVIAALLGVWGKLKSNKATESNVINSVLIQEIEKIATPSGKQNIAGAARDAGVGDSLHEAVKANTPASDTVPVVTLTPEVKL